MRFLYIGLLWEGSTSLERMRLLQRLGCDILPFDITAFTRGHSRIERSLAHRFNFGRPLNSLNNALLTFAREAQFDAIWVDKGVWLYASTLEKLRNRAIFRIAIHYTPDAQFLQHYSRHFVKGIELYDLLITTKPFELELYRQHGAGDVLLVLQGYGPQFRPLAPSQQQRRMYGAEISFIGHCQPHYARRLKELSRSQDGLRIWGPGWESYARLRPWARRCVQGSGIWGSDYPAALASSNLALGLLSKYIPETTTTRTFEIPAMAVFFLAERNAEHLSLFDEGYEAEFFSDDEELRDKASFYLRNEVARNRIAAAGRERCVRSEYSAENQLIKVLKHLRERGLISVQ